MRSGAPQTLSESRWLHRLLVAGTAVLLAAPAGATGGAPEGRVVAAVEIPALHQELNRGREPDGLRSVQLRLEPRPDAPVAVVVESWEELESLEHGAEQVSAAVYEIRHTPDGSWHRVRYATSDGSGEAWLRGEDAGRLRTLFQVIRGSLAYLTSDWNGLLYGKPGGTEGREVQGLGERPDAVVADAADGDGELWLLVVLVNGTICGGDDRSVLAAGWIPVHSGDGSLTVWHYSRGC